VLRIKKDFVNDAMTLFYSAFITRDFEPLPRFAAGRHRTNWETQDARHSPLFDCLKQRAQNSTQLGSKGDAATVFHWGASLRLQADILALGGDGLVASAVHRGNADAHLLWRAPSIPH
jgi:hypothetical protein